MQEKIIVRLSPQIILSFMVLFFPLSSQGTIAYMPQILRECINVACEVAELSNATRNLQELDAMIKENRMLASDDMMRKAVQEAIDAVKTHKNAFRSNKQCKAIKEYLKEYLSSLDNSSVLLTIQGESAHTISWPISFVARSLPNYSVDMDMMHLSNELASINNIQLCGNGVIDVSFYNDLNASIMANVLKESQLKSKHSTIFLSSHMMTSSMSHSPDVTFGTGVASSVISAWSMAPSMSVQSPIKMKFEIPGNLKSDKPISLELHFLVSQQGASAGKARIQVKAKYKHRNVDVDLFASGRAFTYKTHSDNFMITEPHSDDSLKHVSVVIPLKSSEIKKSDLVHLSLTRVEPTSGIEYKQDIYLASAVFRYTRK